MVQLFQLRTYLNPRQRENLKKHQYRSTGCSILETLFLNRFWEWVVLKIPRWVAPNLITTVGFAATVVTATLLILQDLNCEGKAPRWCYLLAAIGVFIYQTLDGVDGKQARRTGSTGPLGEFFDHGLDAFITFLYAVLAACTPGMVTHPYLMLLLSVAVIQLNYTYHWQTYVCGVLHFKSVDIAEALLTQMLALLLTFCFGLDFWHIVFPGVDQSLKLLFCWGTLFFSAINLCSAYSIILTSGVGKNGSTVADTSVVSPIMTPVVILAVALYYAASSPGRLLETNSVIFLTAFILPMSKTVLNMMVAGMTKSPYPLFDSIMLGPLLACVNLYCGSPLPELYVATLLACYNVFDIVLMMVCLCIEFSDTLDVPCFTIPPQSQPPFVSPAPPPAHSGGKTKTS